MDIDDSDSPLRRADIRTTIALAEVKGIATSNNGQDHGPFIVWDISDKGLRLWVPDRIKAGELVKLTIAKPFVVLLNCEIRWCKACQDDEGFQIGARVLDNHQRLEALHKALCAA